MVKTPSIMLPLGTPAPLFSLPDAITGRSVALSTDPGYDATLIMFICNHCPYVKHINHELSNIGRDYHDKKVQILAINANDAEKYPDDSFANMKKTAQEAGYPFPYLYDDTQEVALAYQAKCTPDFFLFDKQLLLVYRGQLDDSRPGNGLPVTGQSLRQALDQVLAQTPVTVIQKPSLGCNIKWK